MVQPRSAASVNVFDSHPAASTTTASVHLDVFDGEPATPVPRAASTQDAVNIRKLDHPEDTVKGYLRTEFPFNDVIQSYGDEISRYFTQIRISRGDGNCYYRAVGYSLMYNCLCNTAIKPKLRTETLRHVITTLSSVQMKADDNTEQIVDASASKSRLIARMTSIHNGNNAWLDDRAASSFTDGPSDPVSAGSITEDVLLRAYNHDNETDYIVFRLMRRLISDYYDDPRNSGKINKEGMDALATVEGFSSFTELVLTNGHEAEQAMCVLLSLALKLPLIVFSVDRVDMGAFKRHQFFNGKTQQEQGSLEQVPFVSALHKPGHYDILLGVPGRAPADPLIQQIKELGSALGMPEHIQDARIQTLLKEKTTDDMDDATKIQTVLAWLT